MKYHTFSQKGSLHLTAVMMVVVIAAVAAIGVKILDTSHANELGSNLITITAPTEKANLSTYQPIFATAKKTERKVTSVTFYVNDKLIVDAGLAKCYPAPNAMPVPAEHTYIRCMDTSLLPNGQYQLVAKMSFLNGTAVRSFPVIVNLARTTPNAFTVKITNPINGATVNGYVPVFVKYSSDAKVVTVTANDKPIVDAGFKSCYPGPNVPTIEPNMMVTCLNSQDAAYASNANIVIKATAYQAGATTASGVVTDTVTVVHPTSVPVPVPTPAPTPPPSPVVAQ